MSDPVLLRKQTNRGTRAKLLMKNELLIEYFENTEAALLKIWKSTKVKDVLVREDAWRTMCLLKRMQDTFEKAIIDGDIAGKQLINLKGPTLVQKFIERV